MEHVDRQLTSEQIEKIIAELKSRFEKNQSRHPNLDWRVVQSRLEANKDKLWTLAQMEQTGGEPDVIGQDQATGEMIWVDCSAESPAGRRSLCYDGVALASRKENRPADSALDMAASWGIELLTEEQYRELQQKGAFDLKTSSWIRTPDSVRTLGGALFGDRRYDRVFVYHNGAESYYSSRGFRGLLRI